MKSSLNLFPVRLSVLAVQSALMAMAFGTLAQAQGIPTVESLTQPTSTIEAGVTYSSPSNNENRTANGIVVNGNGNNTSYKAGEYNGLYKQGATAIGNFDFRGGGAYDSSDPTRWRIMGTDIGLPIREIKGEYGQQGRFRLNFGYDELLRNRSDSYMTPYTGEGTNLFTLPSTWIKPVVPQTAGTATTNTSTGMNFRGLDPVNGTAPGLAAGVVVPPTAATLASQAATRTTDLANYRNVNLSTKRVKSEAGFSYEIDSNWGVTAGIKHETKTGLKPLSVVTSQNTEYAATLADPIQQTTNQYNAAVNYRLGQTFFSAEYYASLFSNDIQSVTWNDVNNPLSTATYAGAPSNQFHQLNLTGGMNFTPTTRLVGNVSYGRNTQNEQFVTAGQNAQFPLGLPVNSLNGLVITKALNLKLTTKPVKDLNVAVNYKFDDRDNRTPVNTYYFQDANETKSGTNAFLAGQGSNLNMYANRPYSRKVNQLDVDADYKLAKGQSIKLGADAQKIDRSCPGSWINCADAPTTKEYTLRADWKARYSDEFDVRVGLAHSKRNVNYDENAFLALVPFANTVPTLGAGVGATGSVYQYLTSNNLTGFGPLAGYFATTGQANIFTPSNNIVPQALYGSRNNINELIGLRRFNMADRDRNKLRASLNWQATEKVSLQAGLEVLNDKYSDSLYGLQSAKGGSLNLEGAFQVSEDFSTSLFLTLEDRKSKAAGDAYGANNNGLAGNSFAGNAANTNVSPVACYSTIAAKNQNAKTDPCLMWTNEMRDRVDTWGMTFKKRGLFSPKFELSGSVGYSRARTDINVSGGSYVANPLAAAGAQPGGVGNYYISASALPTVVADTVELMLNGRYEIDKKSAVRVRYTYTRTKVTDWAYDGMQFGSGTNYLPTNEQSPNFRMQTLGVSYLYAF